jgi:hypothetical protein
MYLYFFLEKVVVLGAKSDRLEVLETAFYERLSTVCRKNFENFLKFAMQPLPLPSEILNGKECLQYSN